MDNGKLHIEIGMDGKKNGICAIRQRAGTERCCSANPEHILCRVLPAGNRRGIQGNHALLREPGGQPGMDEGVGRIRTNLAERLGYEPEEETRERQERLLEELRYREAMRRVAKTCCVWLGGAAFVLAVIAGYAEMTDACVATGAIALGLTTYGIL